MKIIDLVPILIAFISGAFGGTLVPTLVKWIRDSREQVRAERRKSKLTALRLAPILRRLADKHRRDAENILNLPLMSNERVNDEYFSNFPSPEKAEELLEFLEADEVDSIANLIVARLVNFDAERHARVNEINDRSVFSPDDVHPEDIASDEKHATEILNADLAKEAAELRRLVIQSHLDITAWTRSDQRWLSRCKETYARAHQQKTMPNRWRNFLQFLALWKFKITSGWSITKHRLWARIKS